jgi:creatinine amidohydrolase
LPAARAHFVPWRGVLEGVGTGCQLRREYGYARGLSRPGLFPSPTVAYHPGMKRLIIVLLVWAMAGSAMSDQDRATGKRESSPSARSKIYKLEELNWPQIDAFKRERTLVLLPVGMLEEHGPHLPVGADMLGVLYEANAVSRRVSQTLTDWNIVMMPPINYGHAGANLIGDILVHPGTYGIRQSTLRSLVADVGGQLAENGFKWIFVLNGHAAPPHSIAINEACDFISESFRVTMLHLSGLFKADAAIQARGQRIEARHFSAAEISSFGMDVHAGVGETSQLLATRPDLVASSYKTLPHRAGGTHDELRKIATARGWQGYLSSPSKATAAYGREIKEWWIDGFTELVLRAVRGEDLLHHPRLPETIPAAVAPTLDKTVANERAFEVKFENWLTQRRNK